MHWYRIADHDYRVENDYDPYPNINPKMVQKVKDYVGSIQGLIQQKYPGIGPIQVTFVSDDLGGDLGRYVNGTSSSPVIVLSVQSLKKAGEMHWDVDIDTIIQTTILHEIGHAIQDSMGIEMSEEQAEEFANRYYNDGEIGDINGGEEEETE